MGLDITVRSLTANSLSTNTLRSYRSGLTRYISFCNLYSLQAFPLSESVLCRSVASLVNSGESYSTIRLYLSAVRYHQIIEVGPDPYFRLVNPLALRASWMSQDTS